MKLNYKLSPKYNEMNKTFCKHIKNIMIAQRKGHTYWYDIFEK